MSLRLARVFLVVLMLLLTALGTAQAADEVRIIQVDPEAFSAYGHWISEDGEVELRYSSATGTTYADGWQISPGLTQNETPPNAMSMGIVDKSNLSPKRAMVVGVCEMRDSMFAQKQSPETVVAACKNTLRESGMVDLAATSDEGEKVEDGIQHIAGPIYRVYWTTGQTSQMNLGHQETPPTEEQMKAAREDEAYAMFHLLAEHLEAGNMFMITAYPIPRGKFVPRIKREQAAALLREAENNFSQITAKTWHRADLIDYGFAEQARNPLPISRKEGS